MPNTLCFGKGVLQRYISQLIHQIKPIRGNYMNHPKSCKFDNMVLIAESKNIIQRIIRNSGVSNVYKILHAYFEGAELYDGRQCVH